jgi:hypothetical protein
VIVFQASPGSLRDFTKPGGGALFDESVQINLSRRSFSATCQRHLQGHWSTFHLHATTSGFVDTFNGIGSDHMLLAHK